LGAVSGAGAATTVTVTNPTGELNDPPHDDFSGHYLTGTNGEAVIVTQSGKTAFVKFLYMRADHTSGWAVMPDARWGLDHAGRLSFFGRIWRLEPSRGGRTAVVKAPAASRASRRH
jgi:hypothetical protein